MRHLSLGLALALALSGCDAAQEFGARLHKQFRNEVGPMTLVFVPGYKVAIDGLTFSIYGTQLCPRAVTAKVFILGGGYDYPGEGTSTCVVVDPETAKVSVLRVRDGSAVDEVWRVERDDETLRLWTPDGKTVAAAEQ